MNNTIKKIPFLCTSTISGINDKNVKSALWVHLTYSSTHGNQNELRFWEKLRDISNQLFKIQLELNNST